LPAAEEEVGGEEDASEDGYGEGAGGGEGDSGEVEECGFEEGPEGEGGGGVEVPGDVPVSALVVADGGVAVPAFVGVFGPVHPGGVVGGIGGEVAEVEGEKEGGREEEENLKGLEEAGRDGEGLGHFQDARLKRLFLKCRGG